MSITTRPCLPVFVVFCLTFTTACSNKTVNLLGSEGIPDSEFQGEEPVYADGSSVGNLTEAYVQNTESLIIVNGRLRTLCEANEIEECGPQ